MVELEEEDIYYLITVCPAFHDSRVATVQRLKQIVLEHSDNNIWSSYFKDWDPEGVDLSRLCKAHDTWTIGLLAHTKKVSMT